MYFWHIFSHVKSLRVCVSLDGHVVKCSLATCARGYCVTQSHFRGTGRASTVVGQSDLQLMLLQADQVGGGGHGPMGPEFCKL